MKHNTLDNIGLKYNTDKASNDHDYLNLYEKYFDAIRFSDNNIMEIGILNGSSLKMFEEYFTNSTIYSFDIINKKHLQNKRTKIFIGDQSDREFLDKFENNFFDVILDDGSHKMKHQQISLSILFKVAIYCNSSLGAS